MLKKTVKWDIPDDAELPPCKRNRAVFYLCNLLELHNGKQINLFPEDVLLAKSVYKYLSTWGYITVIKNCDLDSLSQAKVANRGIDLIEREYKANKNSLALKSIKINGKVDLSLFQTGIEVEL